MFGPKSGSKEMLKRGAESSQVASLQKVLVNMGYDVGTVDGAFSSSTAAAVEQFQKDHNLKVDGVVGPQTGAAIDHYYKTKLEEQAAMRASQLNVSGKTMPVAGTSTATEKELKPVAKPAAKGLSVSLGGAAEKELTPAQGDKAPPKGPTGPAQGHKSEKIAEAKRPSEAPKAPPKIVQTGFSTTMKPGSKK